MSTKATTKQGKRQWRHARVRAKVAGNAERPRLAVFRSNKHVYAQIIDDASGKTLAGVTDKHADKAAAPKEALAKVATAFGVGAAIAKLAKEKQITKVVFDRGGYRYAGRVKAVADGARAGGLEF